MERTFQSPYFPIMTVSNSGGSPFEEFKLEFASLSGRFLENELLAEEGGARRKGPSLGDFFSPDSRYRRSK